MKTISTILLTTILLSSSLLAKELTKPKESWETGDSLNSKEQTVEKNSWKISGTSETTGVYKYNSGQGANTDTNGNTIRQELGLNARGDLGKGKAGIEMRGRATDDERVSKKKTELLYLRSFYTDDNLDIQAGDVAQTYNPLIFSGTVKGASVTYKQNLAKKQYIQYSVIGGTQASSWNDLVNHRANHTDTIAVDLKYQHATAKIISFTLSGAKERASSEVKARVNDLNTSEAVAAGVKWNWRFNRYIKIKGEAAYTSTNTVATDDKKRSKFAGRVTFYTKPTKGINSNFKYERYASGFNTVVGSSTQDRERLENTSTWSITKALRSRMTLKGSRDNLDGHLGETQNIIDALVSFNYRPEFMKRGDFGLRLQQVARKGRGDDTTQQNIGFDFTNSLKNGWNYGASYDFTDLDNRNDGNRSNKLQTLRAKLGWKTRYNEDHNFRASLKGDISFYDEQTEDRKRYGGTVDAGWDYGTKFMLDMLYTTKNTDRDLGIDSSYELYQLISQYKPFGNTTHVLKLNLQRRENEGGNSTNPNANNYREDEARLSYAFAF